MAGFQHRRCAEDQERSQAELRFTPVYRLVDAAGPDHEKEFLIEVISKFKAAGIRTSIFVDTNLKNVEGAKATGADRIEFYTGPYAAQYNDDRKSAISEFIAAAEIANNLNVIGNKISTTS